MSKTTTPKTQIPARLKAEVDKYYKRTYRSLKALAERRKWPPIILKHILADLRAIVYCKYDYLSLTPTELAYLGTAPYNVDKDLRDLPGKPNRPLPLPLHLLLYKYSTYGAIIRLYNVKQSAPQELRPRYEAALARKIRKARASLWPDLARYFDVSIKEEDLITAAITNYTDFVVLAAATWNATERELEKIPLPPAITSLLRDDLLFPIKSELFANILAVVEYPIASIYEQDKRAKERRDQAAEYIRATRSKISNDEMAQASTPQDSPISQVLEASAAAVSNKIITLYQSNTATLSRPIEALSNATAIVGLGRKPQPLGAIIEAMAGQKNISPTRVMQCLQGLQILAQLKESSVVSYDGNEYYLYTGIKFKQIVKILTGLDNPNGSEIRETGVALSLLSDLRIGHDEDHVVAVKDGKPIIKRYRHYTQQVNIPDIKEHINESGEVIGEAEFTLAIHRLVKTGRRTDKVVIENNQKQRIKIPVTHNVTIGELSEAKRLFQGDDGIRFYNTLLSQNHYKLAAFVAAVNDYKGQEAAAEQRAKVIRSTADDEAARASTIEEAERIKAEADTRAKAIVAATRHNISSGKKRDTTRLYKWLDMAVKAHIIKPYTKTKAKDSSGDFVITWRRYRAQE